MTLRLVQRGEGDSRPLVLGFLVGGLEPQLRAAFGPGPCIVVDSASQGPMLPELLEFAHRAAGLQQVSRLALIGYSVGCQRVRALRLSGVSASAYLLADGTHGSWPPAEWQISWLRELADEAREGRILVVATHTLQTYTERLPPSQAFASTVRVLRMATGWPLDAAGSLDRPAVTREGSLWVYSYASAEMDAPSHAAQLVRVVPELCARHLGPWLRNEAPPEQAKTGSIGGLGLLRIGLLGLAALFSDE